jgi:hypothetical protein
MGFFNETIAAYAASRTVYLALLASHEFTLPFTDATGGAALLEDETAGFAVDFTFTEAPAFETVIIYNWTGYGTLDLDGETWIGKGDLVSFGGIPFNADDVASPISITLSGVEPTFVAAARGMPPVRGGAQQIWLQFFDAATLQPLDDRLLIADRVMDVMRWSGSGPNQRTVSVTSEDVWADRQTAEYGNWSNADQTALFPDDRGLEFVAELVPGRRVTWPDFSV